MVGAQAEPDPDFPTVERPNPEEPGTLDLPMAEAEARGADLLLVNDPDADRLAVAVPGPAGWRRLHGDETGALLADFLLEHAPEPGRVLLVTTVASSTLLGRMAEAAGAAYVETLTGFKWIMRALAEFPDRRLLLGYEEALGYAVSDVVRDKDGISAALVIAQLAASEKRAGRTLEDRLDAIAARFGAHATDQLTLELEGEDGLARMRAADRAPARASAGRAARPAARVRGRRGDRGAPAPRRARGAAGPAALGRAGAAGSRRARGRATERHGAEAQDLPRGGGRHPRGGGRRARAAARGAGRAGASMSDLRGLLGLAAILAVAFLFSNNRARIRWRTVAVGLAVQIGIALLVLRWSVGRDVLDFVAGQVRALIEYTNAGIDFLFGRIVADKEETIFAFQVLPVIIFLSALVGLLYYLRVIQWVVEFVGGGIAWLLRTSKVESLYAATVIFLGQSEAPLMIQS